MQDAFGKDGTLFGFSGFEIVVLNGRDKPAVRVIREWGEVRTPLCLARLACVGVGRLRDCGEIDRAEIAHKARVGDTKADLRRSPWVVAFLSAEDVAESIADGHEVADDPGMLGRDSIGSLAGADGEGDGGAVDDLEKRVVFENVAAFLNGGSFRGGSDLDIWLDREERRGLLGCGFMDARGEAVDGAIEEILDVFLRIGQAAISGSEGAAGPRMAAEDHFGVIEEIAVDGEGGLAVFGGQRLHQGVPMILAARGIWVSPLQEKDVGDDFGSGGGFHGAFRESDGANEIGHGRDMLAGLLIGLVHRPAAGDEGGEAAGFQPLDRTGDKIIVQGESEPAGRIIGTHGAIAERSDMFCRTYSALCCGQIYVAEASFVRGCVADWGLLTQHNWMVG